MTEFEREVADRIAANGADQPLQAAAHGFMKASIAAKYSYNFSWLGRPIIQYPQDIVAMQELIWSLQPDLIVETGIAHGGSLTGEHGVGLEKLAAMEWLFAPGDLAVMCRARDAWDPERRLNPGKVIPVRACAEAQPGPRAGVRP